MDYDDFLRRESLFAGGGVGVGGGGSSQAAKRPRVAAAAGGGGGDAGAEKEERARAKAAAAIAAASSRDAARAAAAVERQVSRAAAAAERASLKEASKQAKSLAKTSTQLEAGRFSGAELGLEMSARLAGSSLGQTLRAEAEAVTAEVKFGKPPGTLEAVFVLPPPAAEPLAAEAPSLRWRRGVVRPAGGAARAGGPVYAFPNPTLKRTVPLEVDFTAAPAEPIMAVVLPGDAWVALAVRLGADGLVRWLRARQGEAPPGTALTVLTHGVLSATVKAADEARRAGRGRPFGEGFSMDALHAHLFVACGVRVTHHPTPDMLVEQVLRLTRWIGARPYKEEDSALLVVARAKADTPWLKMLQTLPGVSARVAAAIAHRFPSMRALMDAYADRSVPEREKAALLEGVMLEGGEEGGGEEGEGEEGAGGGAGSGKGRKPAKLSKLSRDVHAFFTAADPEVEVFVPK